MSSMSGLDLLYFVAMVKLALDVMLKDLGSPETNEGGNGSAGGSSGDGQARVAVVEDRALDMQSTARAYVKPPEVNLTKEEGTSNHDNAKIQAKKPVCCDLCLRSRAKANGASTSTSSQEPSTPSDEEAQPVLYGKIRRNAKRKRSCGAENEGRTTAKVPRPQNDQVEMVPIGSGHTLVPYSVYVNINWQLYTVATRKLLVAVFPRSVLASHSLTGKASPAFQDKPAKACLDPRKVEDIVLTVSAKSNVKRSLVRNAITTKLADENKMKKMKEKKLALITIKKSY